MDYVYDIETYPNVFTLAVQSADRSWQTVLEISEFRNEAVAILAMLKWFDQQGHRMVGFNNLGFDYPVVHLMTQIGPSVTAPHFYQQAMAIIRGQDEDRWRFQVKPSDRVVEQIDLYRIHHFDNRARATSLKALEFALRMDKVKDVPCRVGTVHMHNLLDKIYKGKGTAADLALLEELCDMVANTSLCGLGQTAPNPVVSTLRYFRPEYETLIAANTPAMEVPA